MKKRKTFDKGIIFIVLILIIIGATAVFFLSRMNVDPMADALNKDDSVSMAFMIVDGKGCCQPRFSSFIR